LLHGVKVRCHKFGELGGMDASPNGAGGADRPGGEGGELKATLLAGLIGAVVGAAGYLIYSRLEDDQKSQIRTSVSKFFEDKISDLRTQIKL